MILLDLTHEAASTAGDAGLYAAIAAASGAGGTYIKMVVDKAKMKKDIENLEKEHTKDINDIKEKMIEVTTSKKALKVELEASLKEKEQVLHARIDRVRDDNIKSYEKLENKIDELKQQQQQDTQRILEAVTSRK